MARITCHVAGCLFTTKCDKAATAQAKLVHHVAVVYPGALPRAPTTRPPPLDRPKLEMSCSPAEFSDFAAPRRRFRTGSNITADTAGSQLLQCLSDELFLISSRSILNIDTLSVDDLMVQVKPLAVLSVAIGVENKICPASCRDS